VPGDKRAMRRATVVFPAPGNPQTLISLAIGSEP
jgi:hypothetical protein